MRSATSARKPPPLPAAAKRQARTKSGIRPAMVLTEQAALPRLSLPSSPDLAETGITGVCDVIEDLARLADPSCIPRLNRTPTSDDILSPPETFVVMLVDSHLDMQAILDMSPMREDATLRFLAGLVTKGIVSLAEAPRN